jgi:hypothetical protein
MFRKNLLSDGVPGHPQAVTEANSRPGAGRRYRHGFADAYGTVRRAMPGDAYKDDRVPVQDALVGRAESLAQVQPFNAAELRGPYPKATPVLRVVILG